MCSSDLRRSLQASAVLAPCCYNPKVAFVPRWLRYARGAAMGDGMGRLKVVGVIPARLASERLPGKVLLELDGKAMVHHVYANARGCPLLDELLIATDAEPVREYCQRNGIPVAMTSPSHTSGTERIREVANSQDRKSTRLNSSHT